MGLLTPYTNELMPDRHRRDKTPGDSAPASGDDQLAGRSAAGDRLPQQPPGRRECLPRAADRGPPAGGRCRTPGLGPTADPADRHRAGGLARPPLAVLCRSAATKSKAAHVGASPASLVGSSASPRSMPITTRAVQIRAFGAPSRQPSVAGGMSAIRCKAHVMAGNRARACVRLCPSRPAVPPSRRCPTAAGGRCPSSAPAPATSVRSINPQLSPQYPLNPWCWAVAR